ncbi:InlB B-repeat-containing protein, partial [Oscillospiraceae bacterium PP1C4]
ANCSGLTSISIPDSVTTINSSAFANCSGLTSIVIGANVKTIASNAFSGTTSLEFIFVNQIRAGSTIAHEGTWGAADSVPIYWLGQFVSFNHTVSLVPGKYERNINIQAAIETGVISSITLPNGTVVNIADKEWLSVYNVSANGTYTFTGLDDKMLTSTYTVTITDIGKPTITANDALLFASTAQAMTKDALLALVNAQATTLEKGDSFAPGSIEVRDSDLAAIRALTMVDESVEVTLEATSPTGLTDSVTVTITVAEGRQVIFDTNGGTPIPPVQSILMGQKVTQPVEPSKEGYTFAGWYTDDTTFLNLWDFNNDRVGAEGFTLYAKWEINQYEIIFSDWNDTIIYKEMLNYGSTIPVPENPSRQGHTFSGWDKEVASTAPSKNLSYKAIYEINKYNIVAIVQGNGTVTPSGTTTVEYGSEITYTITPHSGHKISDVKIEDVSIGPVGTYTFTNVSADQKIEAIFEINSSGGGGGGVTEYFTLSFETNGGTEIKPQRHQEYANVQLIMTTSKAGYVFDGWYLDSGLTDKGTSVYMDMDKTVYAKWKADDVTVDPDPTPDPDPVSDSKPIQESEDANVAADEDEIISVIKITPDNDGLSGNGGGKAEGDVDGDGTEHARPELGAKDGHRCILHWILWIISGILFSVTLIRRRKNQREVEELLGRRNVNV